METPLVIISCLAYNHEPYIGKCLDGFVNQITNFPFYAVVHDDCSTDKTKSIIQEYAQKYPEIIHPIYEKENQYSKANGSLSKIMFEATKQAKYIAICEGDDYWTDSYKLQKQVDLLESKETLVGVITNSSIVDLNNHLIQTDRTVLPNNITGEYDLQDFLKDNHQYPTLTAVYRNPKSEILLNQRIRLANPYLGDWILWILLFQYGNFYFLNESTAAYRINPTSLTHTVNEIKRWEYDFVIRKQLIEILPSKYKKYLSNNWNAYWQLGNVYRKQKNMRKMLWSLFRSFLCNPYRFSLRLLKLK